MKTRTYSELIEIEDFYDRLTYLQLNGKVGSETFGIDRYLNQVLYNSREWRNLRDRILIRDNSCDLGVEGFYIDRFPIIHHMNPITIQQVIDRDPIIFNPEFLITTTRDTHNNIHYGFINKPEEFNERKKGDTCLWKTI